MLEDNGNMTNSKCEEKVTKSDCADRRKATKVIRSPFKEITNKTNKLVSKGLNVKKPLTYLEAVKGNGFKKTPNGKFRASLNVKALAISWKTDTRVG